jgi:hypothetical protein
VPPLSKEEIPIALRSEWYDSSDAGQLLAKAAAEFERRAGNDYYSE